MNIDINNTQNLNGNGRLISNKFYAYKVTALIILSYFLLGSLISILSQTIIPDKFENDFNSYSQGILEILIILFPAIYFAKRSHIPFEKLMRIKHFPSFKQISLAVIGILAFQALATGYTSLQEKLIPDIFLSSYNFYDKLIENSYISLLGGTGVFAFLKAILIGAIIPAISEESLFRGFLQRSLEEDNSVVKSILITSLIFSLLHMNPIGLIPLMGIGIYLGFLAWASKSLILPVIAHFINNALAVIIIFTPNLSKLDEQSSNLSIMESFSFLAAGIIVMITSCYLLNSEHVKENESKIQH